MCVPSARITQISPIFSKAIMARSRSATRPARRPAPRGSGVVACRSPNRSRRCRRRPLCRHACTRSASRPVPRLGIRLHVLKRFASDCAWVRAVGVHQIDVRTAAVEPDVRDPLAVRRPRRRGVIHLIHRGRAGRPCAAGSRPLLVEAGDPDERHRHESGQQTTCDHEQVMHTARRADKPAPGSLHGDHDLRPGVARLDVPNRAGARPSRPVFGNVP